MGLLDKHAGNGLLGLMPDLFPKLLQNARHDGEPDRPNPIEISTPTFGYSGSVMPASSGIIDSPAASLNGQASSGPEALMMPSVAGASARLLPSFAERLNAALMGLANGGAPIPALANLVGGLLTGERMDPTGSQQQTELETYKALRASGASDAQARAAALNPGVLRAIAPDYLGGWKVVKTGDDAIKGKQYMMQGPGGQLHPLESFVRSR